MGWDPFSFISDTVDFFVEDIPGKAVDIAEDAIDWVSDTWEDTWDTISYYSYGWIMDAFIPDMPSIPSMGGSPTYNTTNDRIGNTIKEGLFVSRCYGKCKIGGNKIRFNAADDTDLRIIVGHCMGPVKGYSDLKVNDVAWADLEGSHTVSEYFGTRDQTVDARFSSDASAFRSIAYSAFTFEKNDKQVGYNPNITVVMEGLRCTKYPVSFVNSGTTWDTLYATGYYETTAKEIGYFTNATIKFNGVTATYSLNVAALGLGEWGVGGSGNLFVRLFDDTDPDTKADDWVMVYDAIEYSRNPAIILYDWYREVEGYSDDGLNLNAFKSLEALCDEVPSGSSLPRYRFDFNFDTDIAINDAKKLIWASFNGLCIMSQGKIKPIWDSSQMADGSGGLTAKTVSHAFNMDNIEIGSFTWNQNESPNIVRINYKDSATNYRTSSVDRKDESDIENNGEILYKEDCWYITDEELARRRANLKFNKKRYADYSCSLNALSGASDVEVLDLVTGTHTLPGWTDKEFLVVNRTEDPLGKMTFALEAYYSGSYDDSQTGTQANYGSDLPNPWVTLPVTSTTLEESGFIAGDGSYVPYVTLTFTRPNNIFWFRGQVFVSTDAGANYTFYGNDTTGEGYRIEAGAANYWEGDTLYVKVLSENNNGVVQPISAVSSVLEYIYGKTALPSDVQNFSVQQIGDIVIFSSDRPDRGTDADFSHFELRQGSSWSSSGPVATYTQTKYPLTDFTAGAKTYRIKAVDSSGNKSLNDSTASITLTAPSTQNIFYEEENIDRIEQGTVSQVARNYVFDYAGGFFITGTETMDDDAPEKMDDSGTDRMWTAAHVTGYLETEAIDAGSLVNGAIYLEVAATSYTGGGYSVEYKTSTDDVTYTAYANFADGVTGIFRYLIFKITLTADTGSYPEDNIKITSLIVTLDLPTTINESVTDETIAAGGTTITFETPYTTAESIQISITPISATALLATHETATKTNFKAHLFDTDGNNVGGTASWRAEGF